MKKTRPLFTAESIDTLIYAHKDIRHDKATKEQGYTPRPLEETLRDSVRWFQDNGMLPKRAAA
jgi:dihydroflavonol-4-reductase